MPAAASQASTLTTPMKISINQATKVTTRIKSAPPKTARALAPRTESPTATQTTPTRTIKISSALIISRPL
jgi:hypothetical protein